MKSSTQLAIGAICASASVVTLMAQEAVRQAQVMSWEQGEVLFDQRDRITTIKVSPVQGSKDLALVTQDMPPGTGIPIHRHDRSEEILFIHSGSATVILGDEQILLNAGDIVYVPPGTYHGLENPQSSVQILGVVTPPGLEHAFREMFWHPGEPPKELSEHQRTAIGEKYDNLMPGPE